VKLDEARDSIEMAVALEPDLLEIVLRSRFHLEPVHGNEHYALLKLLLVPFTKKISKVGCVT
jgi:hypothetical protein